MTQTNAILRCALAGSWQLADCLELQWSEGDQWTAVADLPAGRIVEYKYVLVDSASSQGLSWQQGNNSVLALRLDDREVQPAIHSLPACRQVLACHQKAPQGVVDADEMCLSLHHHSACATFQSCCCGTAAAAVFSARAWHGMLCTGVRILRQRRPVIQCKFAGPGCTCPFSRRWRGRV